MINMLLILFWFFSENMDEWRITTQWKHTIRFPFPLRVSLGSNSPASFIFNLSFRRPFQISFSAPRVWDRRIRSQYYERDWKDTRKKPTWRWLSGIISVCATPVFRSCSLWSPQPTPQRTHLLAAYTQSCKEHSDRRTWTSLLIALPFYSFYRDTLPDLSLFKDQTLWIVNSASTVYFKMVTNLVRTYVLSSHAVNYIENFIF